MIRDVAVTRIQYGLGFRTDLADTIVLRMQESQRNLEQGKTLPWFLQYDSTLALLDGVSTVSIETGFIREVEFYPMRYVDANTQQILKIRKVTFEDGLDAYSDAADASPKVYSVGATNYTFFPIPDANYTIYHTIYKKGVTLDTNNENVWLLNAPEVIIGDAGARIATDLRDADAVQLFKNMRDAAWQAVFNETIMREEAARKQSVGSGL